MPNIYALTHENPGAVTVTLTVSGQASLDEMIDAMRGFLVACSYHPDTASRLQIVEAIEDTV
jgi:hypothetical protein